MVAQMNTPPFIFSCHICFLPYRAFLFLKQDFSYFDWLQALPNNLKSKKIVQEVPF